MLKRIAAVPISRSQPTVAMDKSLDLLPALVIMAMAPLLGLRMDVRLWLVLGTVAGLLISLAGLVALSVLKPTAAVAAVQRTMGMLPRGLGRKVEAVAAAFVESLLSAASRPHVFLPAVALAMFVFSHSWAAVVMCTTGPICLKTLGLTMPGVMRAQNHLPRELDASAESTPAREVLSPGF